MAATEGGETGSTSLAVHYSVSFSGDKHILEVNTGSACNTEHARCWWTAHSKMANLCEFHLKYIKNKKVQTIDLKISVHSSNKKTKLLKIYKVCLFICLLR